MMTNCGCREISHDPIEFKIQDYNPQVHINCGPLLPNTNEEDWCKLQNKIICDFEDIIKQLECGIQPDIEIILEEISLIFMNGCGYNVAKRMYSTDLEEDYFLRHNNFLSEFETQEERDQVLLNLGIYEKINNMITKSEVNDVIESTKSQFNDIVDNNVAELNEKLNTKVGFITKIGKYYCGFASSIHYAQWLETENDNLIIGRWIGGEYVPDEYTIVFNNFGGDPVHPITVIEGFPITFPIPTWSSDSARVFDGWYTNYDAETQEYSGTKYNPGDKIIPKLGMVFYGKWHIEHRILTFYPNYGDNTPFTQNIPLFRSVNLSEVISREGYTFTSWNTESNGNGTSYSFGQSYMVEMNQSFYAQWQINQYTVTFNSNENQFGDQNQIRTIIVNYGTQIQNIQFPEFSRNYGYIVKGWNIDLNGNETNPLTISGDTTFYAQWIPIVYNINYTLNANIIFNTNKTSYTIESENITLDTPEYLGHTFIGWYTDQNLEGNSVSTINTGSYGSKHFYAKWSVNSYTITLVFNDEHSPNQVINVQYDTVLNSILNTPEYEGYLFKGWKDINGNTIERMPANDITLYAQWQEAFRYKLSTSIPTEEPSWSYSTGKQITLKELEGWDNWKNQLYQYLIFLYNNSDNINDYFEHIDDYGNSLTDMIYSKVDNNINSIIVFKRKTRNTIGEDNKNNRVRIK